MRLRVLDQDYVSIGMGEGNIRSHMGAKGGRGIASFVRGEGLAQRSQLRVVGVYTGGAETMRRALVSLLFEERGLGDCDVSWEGGELVGWG